MLEKELDVGKNIDHNRRCYDLRLMVKSRLYLESIQIKSLYPVAMKNSISFVSMRVRDFQCAM